MEFYVHTYNSEILSNAIQEAAIKVGYLWGGSECCFTDKSRDDIHFHEGQHTLIFNMDTERIWYHTEHQMDNFVGVDTDNAKEWTLDEAFGYFEEYHPAKSVKLNNQYEVTFEEEGFVTIGRQKVSYEACEKVVANIQKIREQKDD